MSNWEVEVEEREIDVTGMREKWTVTCGEFGGLLEEFEDLLEDDLRLLEGRQEIMRVVRGSREVFEEGTRMPRRIGFGGMVGILDICVGM